VLDAELMQVLLRNIPVACYLERVRPDGRVERLFTSPAVETLFGFSAEEWQEVWQDRLHPDDRQRVLAALARWRRGESGSIEYRGLTREGRYIWVREQVQALRESDCVLVVGAVRDIPEAGSTWGPKGWIGQLVEKSSDVIYRYELAPERGITYISPTVTALIGYTPEECYADPDLWLRIVHADDRHLLERMAESRNDLVDGPATVRWHHKDGRVIWTELVGVPIRDKLGNPIAIAGRARDLSHQREAEERYRVLFREMMDGFAVHEIILDERGQPCDYRFLEVNPAFERLTGLKAQEVIGHTAREVLPGLEPEWVETYGEVALTGKALSFMRYAEPLGRHYLVRAFQVGPGRFATVFSDVTDSIKAQEELREREAKYRLVVEGGAEGIVVVAGDRLRFFNSRALELVGWSEEEFRQRPWFEFVHPDDRDMVVQRYEQFIRSESVSGSLELRIIDASGNTRWVEVRDMAAVWEGETALIAFVTDITERKRLEEQYLQAQKMEAVGRLAGGVAHDFNNLITALIGQATFALQELPPHHPAREDVAGIMDLGNRASQLTRQLLAFSRRQILSPGVVDLNELIVDIDKLLGRVIGEDIDLITIPGANLAAVRVDPACMEQVLMNLVVNARDAMPEGGKLTIETGNVVLDEAYASTHPEVTPGEYVSVAVTDTGLGMTEEVRQHLFEPFFTTKEPGKGTGLGLATVYGIVKQHGGHIWVYSEPGQGTTFKIYLPAVAELPQALPRRDEEGYLPVGTETVLLVEDSPTVRGVAARMLRDQGYTVLVAADGREALRVVQEYSEPIHLLVTDVVMPQMGGRELAERLRSARPGFRVLYMTGYTDNAIVHHGVLEEGVNLLQKPFTAGMLVRKVREVLD